MTAVCLTLSGDEHNHLGIQEHTADVQTDNERGCDICCQWMLAQSCTEVGTCGWLAVCHIFSNLLVLLRPPVRTVKRMNNTGVYLGTHAHLCRQYTAHLHP